MLRPPAPKGGLRLLFLLAMALGALAPTAQAQGHPVSLLPPVAHEDARFGIVEAYQASGLAKTLGARWERVFFWWNLIQPQKPAEWRPYAPLTDAQIDQELANGMTLVGILANPPAWATRNGSVPLNLDLPTADPRNYWAQFVRRVVGQYKGRINTWTIWNEPDIDVGLPGNTWGGEGREFVQLLKVAYLAAKEANPQSRIVFSGTTYWVDQGMDRQIFLERILKIILEDPTTRQHNYFFDAVALHLYGNPRSLYEVPRIYRRVLRKYGLEKPIWISETNVVPWNDPAAPLPPGGYRATLEEQANFVIQAFAMGFAGGVARLGIYKMQDGQLFDGEAYGLVRNDLSPRPAAVAYQVAATYLAGLGLGSYQRHDGWESVTFQRGGRRVTVLWSTAKRPVTAKVKGNGTSALLVSKTGQTRPLAIPLEPERNFYAIALPPPTIDLPGWEPGTYMIGGDPFILVEEGVGEGVRIDQDRLFYPIVGHYVVGAFLRFFDGFGGLGSFGYPRTGEIEEGGRRVQYFQRARFEHYPNLAGTPFEVQLGLLADELTRARQPFPKAASPIDQRTRRLFPQTGYSVGPPFLRFFDERGGIALFGYPISEEIAEERRIAQYFQRMRLEFHPPLVGTRYEVQLGLVGDEYLQAQGRLR